MFCPKSNFAYLTVLQNGCFCVLLAGLCFVPPVTRSYRELSVKYHFKKPRMHLRRTTSSFFSQTLKKHCFCNSKSLQNSETTPQDKIGCIYSIGTSPEIQDMDQLETLKICDPLIFSQMHCQLSRDHKFESQSSSINFAENDFETFLTASLYLLPFEEGHLSVIGKRMYTQYQPTGHQVV